MEPLLHTCGNTGRRESFSVSRGTAFMWVVGVGVPVPVSRFASENCRGKPARGAGSVAGFRRGAPPWAVGSPSIHT